MPTVRHLRETSAAKVIRAELMSLGMELGASRRGKAILRLERPRISAERLKAEWSAATAILRPDIARRISLQATYADGRGVVLGSIQAMNDAPTAAGRPSEGLLKLPRRDLGFAVEKVLMWAWLLRKGPLTRVWIQQVVGCAYPTVSGVLRRLGSAVARHPDRRIELGHLPPAAWRRLVAVAPAARCTLLLADRSGQGNAADHLERLQALAPPGVAVGGVAAARRLHPELDLTGLPRLDLSVHAPHSSPSLSFLRKVDPALEPARSDEPVAVAIHFIRHHETLFEPSGGGVPWADRLEVLLDLHEAGLIAQATELFDALTVTLKA